MSSCYDLCQFPQPPSGDFRCPVDGGVLRDAVRSRKCGHHYGMQCILTYLLKNKESCPVCSTPMDVSHLEPAEGVRKKVLSLPMACRELDKCNWVGAVQDEPAHAHGPYCGVYMIQCPFCELRVSEGDAFEAHKNECPEAIVVCELCYEDMPRKELAMHQKGLGGRICRLTTPMKRQKEAALAGFRARLNETERKHKVQQEMERMERMSFHQSMGAGNGGASPPQAEQNQNQSQPKVNQDQPSIIKEYPESEENTKAPEETPMEAPIDAETGTETTEPPGEEEVSQFFAQLPNTVDGVQAALYDLTKRHEDLERRHYLLQQTVHDLIDYISSRDMDVNSNRGSAEERGTSLPSKAPEQPPQQTRQQYRSVKPLSMSDMSKKAAFDYVFSGMKKGEGQLPDVTPPRQLFNIKRSGSPQPAKPSHLPPLNAEGTNVKSRPMTSPVSTTKKNSKGNHFTEINVKTGASHKPKAPAAPPTNSEGPVYKRASVSLASSFSSVDQLPTTPSTHTTKEKRTAGAPTISITTPSSTKKSSSMKAKNAEETKTPISTASPNGKSPIQYSHKISSGKGANGSPHQKGDQKEIK